jgi:hypothetical protein
MGLVLGSGPATRLFIWIFLARGYFATKTPTYEGWISLDSLVRNKTYQWVTRHKSRRLRAIPWKRAELLIGQA